MAPTLCVIPKKPELVVPAKPTPRGMKAVSDIDDQDSLRLHIPVIMFYRNNPSMEGLDPVKIIRKALAKTLVYYYPYAGRIVEGPDHKLVVDCTAEGVLFSEADASVRLDELGDAVRPPCQYPELLLFDVPGFEGVLIGCPLMLVQVTRFKCGGFALAIRFNHVMSDGLGSLQFTTTMSEMAKGASTPSILPVWKRELLTARHPRPCVTHPHPEYDEDDESVIPSSLNDKNYVKRSFSFGPEEINAIKKNLPPELRSSSKFELISACLWRSRTRALQFDPNDNVRIICAVDIRSKHFLDLPLGYYVNAVICPARVSKVKTLCGSPLEYALKLVKEAKQRATGDSARSTIDFIATNGRPKFMNPWNYIVTDASKLGFDKVDFGWGNAIYGGTMYGGVFNITIYARYRNKKGEDVVVTPMILPIAAMERFENELRTLICGPSKL